MSETASNMRLLSNNMPVVRNDSHILSILKFKESSKVKDLMTLHCKMEEKMKEVAQALSKVKVKEEPLEAKP